MTESHADIIPRKPASENSPHFRASFEFPRREPLVKKTAASKPLQARAKVTVEAILEAAIRILEKEGLEGATTTRIAELAGVSVGTLYHHFADRDAIVQALQDREFVRALAMMEDVLSSENLGAAPRETVERVVRGLARLYEVSPGLHRVLAIEGLRAASAGRVEAFDVRVIAIIRTFLQSSRDVVRCEDVEAAAFVAYQSVRATMLAFLLERPPGLDLDRLVAQLVDLVVRYAVRDDA